MIFLTCFSTIFLKAIDESKQIIDKIGGKLDFEFNGFGSIINAKFYD